MKLFHLLEVWEKWKTSIYVLLYCCMRNILSCYHSSDFSCIFTKQGPHLSCNWSKLPLMLMKVLPVKGQTVFRWLQVTGLSAVQRHRSTPHFYSFTTSHRHTHIYLRTLLSQIHNKLHINTKCWRTLMRQKSKQYLNVWKQQNLNRYICFELGQPVGKTNSFGMNRSAWNPIYSLFTIVNLIQSR